MWGVVGVGYWMQEQEQGGVWGVVGVGWGLRAGPAWGRCGEKESTYCKLYGFLGGHTQKLRQQTYN